MVENTDRRVRPALLTMFLGSFTLVTAEFLPPLRTPHDGTSMHFTVPIGTYAESEKPAPLLQGRAFRFS